jgi:hypothetical protein
MSETVTTEGTRGAATIEAGAMVNDRREKLLALYGGALIKTLLVAESLQAVAEGLQAAINRLAEVDAAMAGHLEGISKA